MRVNLISQDNGVGLTRDIQLLGDFLRANGYATSFVPWQSVAPKADLNIYLELFDHRHLDSAKRHIGIFNLEWFKPEWREYLGSFDQLWAKSVTAFEWYMEHHLDTAHYTGFLSRDMFNPTIAKQPGVLHVRGKSSAKGTEALLDAYRKHADLPRLTVVTYVPVELMTNVDQWLAPSDEKLRELMNEHSIHACPSIVEGWGHHIAEAISCKAIVLTTDASPMSDHVTPAFGKLMSPSRSQEGEFSTAHYVDPDVIAESIRWATQLDDVRIAEMRSRARAHWQTRQTMFKQQALKLLKGL